MNSGAGAVRADYDRIAPTYDRRYVDNTYPGTEAANAAARGDTLYLDVDLRLHGTIGRR